jgi:hypothetical protein
MPGTTATGQMSGVAQGGDLGSASKTPDTAQVPDSPPTLATPLPMPRDGSLTALISGLLDMLRAYQANLPMTTEPVQSLLARCAAQTSLNAARQPAPLRLVHHFARAGGTVISRMLAAQPGTVVLSEIEPFSRNVFPLRYAPTDLILSARHTPTGMSDATIAAMLVASLTTLRDRLSAEARHLVLRVHSHSRYCFGEETLPGPPLAARLAAHFPLRQIITVRHPLDSYASLLRKGWVHFMPPTLADYARRYQLFLDEHPEVPIFAYEEFASDPGPQAIRMAAALHLPHRADWSDLMPVIRLSGDDAPIDGPLRLSPRGPLQAAILAEVGTNPGYAALCARLGYDPDPAGSILPRRNWHGIDGGG